MFAHPDLAALRCDDAPQRQAQANLVAALADWKDSAEARALSAEIAALAAGDALQRQPGLAAMFGSGTTAAHAFAERLVLRIATALAINPLAQVPLRHATDGTASTVMLARNGGVTLFLQALDGRGLAARPAPVSANFSPGETWECVLAGAGEAEHVVLVEPRPGGALLERRPVQLQAGSVLYRHGAREALLIGRVTGVLVTLKLQRRDLAGPIAREYALADGALIHQAAASSRDSRLELAAALLGRMGRSDAAPLLGAMAEEQGSAALRWQALRECLGLDTAVGFAALCRIAGDPADPLAAPAGALRAQLIERHPQLAGLDPCPA